MTTIKTLLVTSYCQLQNSTKLKAWYLNKQVSHLLTTGLILTSMIKKKI